MPDPDHDARSVTIEELHKLPRWAIVAFAARCATRVQPVYHFHGKDGLKDCVEDLDEAITLAQASAADPLTAQRYSITFDDARDYAFNAADAFGAALGNTHAAVAAAYAVARAAASARTTVRSDDTTPATLAIVDALDARNDAINAFPQRDARTAHAAIREDYNHLLATTIHERWTDDTPVPPDFFGPLWPHGEPEGWPQMPERTPEAETAEPGVPTTAPLSLYFDAQEFDAETIALIIHGLSELYRGIADDELVIDDVTVLSHAAAPEEVC